MPRGRGRSTSPRDARSLIHAIPAFVWWSHPDGTVQFVNRRWRDYTGLSAEEALGSGWKTAIHDDDEPGFQQWDEGPIDVRLRDCNGVFRWFSLCRGPRFDKNHAVREWYVIGIEIEDRKRKELLRIAERRTVRMIADDASLVPILNELCAAINELTGAGPLCSSWIAAAIGSCLVLV
jgi:PAS domain S-box-containing protein